MKVTPKPLRSLVQPAFATLRSVSAEPSPMNLVAVHVPTIFVLPYTFNAKSAASSVPIPTPPSP